MSVATDDEDDDPYTASMLRHPAWLARLDEGDYYPISRVAITMLRAGDIIDVREVGIEAPTGNEYLTIDTVQGDLHGVYSFAGALPHGNRITIARDDGLPMVRRRLVRYAIRAKL